MKTSIRIPRRSLLVLTLLSCPLMSHADTASAGKEVFDSNCAICHSVANPPRNKVGPSLFGVVGRVAGTAAGFTYSDAMKGAGHVWTKEKLNAYIMKPTAEVPGNKMPFDGLSDEGERAALVEFLAQQH